MLAEWTVVVVVDTTATFTDVMLSSTRWMQLLSMSAKLEIRLVIPEVVLRETSRHWEKEALRAASALRGGLAKLPSSRSRANDLGLDVSKVEVSKSPPPELAVDQAAYLGKMRTRLQGLNVEIPPLPAVGLEAILERDLAARKPFSVSGKGFRDALIWESLLEFISVLSVPNMVYFVTSNSDDYCQGGDIHPHLVDDMCGVEVDFKLVDDLDVLLNEEVFRLMLAALLSTDEELAKFLVRVAHEGEIEYPQPLVGEIVTSAVASAVENLVNEEVDNGNPVSTGLDFTGLGIPEEFESLRIDFIDYLESLIDWETYETYDDTTLLIRATVTADISFEGFAYKSDAAIFDDDRNSEVIEWDWNSHMMRISTSVEARLVFQLRVEAGAGVEDVEFEAAESIGAPR